jgi:hypothetical protein
MWIYFCSLQIAMVISTEANMTFPASVSVFMKAILDTINLSGFDKKQFLDMIGLSQLDVTEGSFLKNLSGLTIALIIAPVALVFLLLMVKIAKHPKVQALIRKA